MMIAIVSIAFANGFIIGLIVNELVRSSSVRAEISCDKDFISGLTGAINDSVLNVRVKNVKMKKKEEIERVTQNSLVTADPV